jgi:glucose/arabinose dehydrogenase
MAFDPDYATNRKFYLNFTAPGGAFGNGVTHVSQFQVRPGKHRKRRIREKILVRFDQPQSNHNGGWIGFSPRPGDESNLYIATGNGGGANDQGSGHIEPGGNAQNNATLLGKVLRVHVDSVLGRISIPPENRFFGSSAFRPEIWISGLRNPCRASFDRQNGRMFIGDVGQNTREEVDVQEASNAGGGENYQWRLREGTIATPTGNPAVGGPAPLGSAGPIIDYGRSTGGTIIGGYVYRGTAVPALQGKYVFGDFLAGKIFTLDYNGTTASNFQDITSQLFPTREGGFGLGNPSSFGEDASGELYITDLSTGSVYKIVP